MPLLKRLLLFAATAACIYLAGALVLVFSQRATNRDGGAGLDFSSQVQRADEPAALGSYEAPDGTVLGFRLYDSGNENVPLLMLVHGSGWHGLALDPLARRVADAGLADVVVPDLRGHGPAPERRGDIDHIGQFEDDLHALYVDQGKPGQPFVMGGHSSGGGLVVRYSGGVHGETLSGAVLLAPFLKYNAPTTRQNSGGWAHALTRRIVGLTMLNAVGITVLNGLPVIDFAFPRAVLDGPLGDTATRRYSYRLNRSFAPRSDYLADIATLPPFLLVAGREDEAFFADRYEATMSQANDQGTFVLLDGVSHLEVMHADGTFEALARYLPTVVAQ